MSQSLSSSLMSSGRTPFPKEGCIRINVRSRHEIRINESLEMPENMTLRSLRLFLRKTFPYLPYRFEFETESKVRVDIELEIKILVSTMGTVVYLIPWIPKYPKGHEKAEKRTRTKGRSKDDGNNGNNGNNKNNKSGKLSPLRAKSPGNDKEWVDYDNGGDGNNEDDALVPPRVRRKILDAWQQDKIARISTTGSINSTDNNNNNNNNNNNEESYVGTAFDISTIMKTQQNNYSELLH